MDILEALKTDIQKAIGLIDQNKKHRLEAFTWDYLNKEYNGNERDLRESQVGRIQKDKIVGTGENAKSIAAIRLSIPFAKKIVNTAVAFELGEPVTLIVDDKNDLYNSVKSTWKLNRMDSKLQEALKKKKSELESCIIFHIEDVPSSKTWITKLFMTQKKRIKSEVKTNKQGRMYPMFDDYGNMQMFVWRFTTKNETQSEIDNIWIYTDTERIDLDNSTDNTYSITSRKPHGFDRIPVVYLEQDYPEWEDVKTLIDRFEVALSKLGGSNDYAGYPLLKLYGELVSMPDRNDDGKTLRFPMKEVDDTGKTIHGDAEFLTANNAVESVKLELEKLYSLIHAMSSTPDIAFENLKGLGAMSGVALKLMFLDAIIKAKMNEGDNRTMVERCLNIIASGTKKTVETKLSKQNLLVSVQFNSILPSDLKEAVEIATSAVEGGVMSIETAVDYLDMVEDKEKEIERINKQSILI